MEANKLFKKKMREKKVTNFWLSQRTGINQSQLSRYFTGKIDLRMNDILLICEELNIKLRFDES